MLETGSAKYGTAVVVHAQVTRFITAVQDITTMPQAVPSTVKRYG
jgi:hypothetical protein